MFERKNGKQMEGNKIKIKAEPLVDPAVCKFVVDYPIFPGHSFNFANKELAKGSPLIEALFAIDGIAQVHVSENIVTVAKVLPTDWAVLGKVIGAAIRHEIASGNPMISHPLIEQLKSSQPGSVLKGSDSEMIQRLLDEQINPAVAAHGGHVSLIDVKGDTVYVQLGGGCQGCGMVDVTLKQGIEASIKQVLPHIQKILDVTDHASGTNPYYQPSQK